MGQLVTEAPPQFGHCGACDHTGRQRKMERRRVRPAFDRSGPIRPIRGWLTSVPSLNMLIFIVYQMEAHHGTELLKKKAAFVFKEGALKKHNSPEVRGLHVRQHQQVADQGRQGSTACRGLIRVAANQRRVSWLTT